MIASVQDARFVCSYEHPRALDEGQDTTSVASGVKGAPALKQTTLRIGKSWDGAGDHGAIGAVINLTPGPE